MAFDTIHAIKFYIDKIVSDPKISGMKVLLLDSDTTKIVSMVYSQSQILEKEVFLVEPLNVEHERMTHLKAAVFIRPTSENILALKNELKDPKFGEYHIFFSNIVSQEFLEQIAEADELEVVRQIQEYYGDFLAVNAEVFHMGVRESLLLSLPRDGRSFTPQQHTLFHRTVEGISSVLLSLKKKPVVRYAASSEICKQLAIEITSNMQKDGLFDFRRQDVAPLLLILDRRDDPVTPLLTQWTYQAMVHELIGLDDNRVDMSQAPGIRPDMKELVLSCTQDEFFKRHMYSNFGDLGVAIKGMVDEYKMKTKSNENIQSIEDMQRFMDNYPQFRAQSHIVSKHVSIMTEMARLVEEQSLMDVSQFEQELASNEDLSAHFRELIEKLRNPKIKADNKIRLAILYALRYETNNGNQISQVKTVLEEEGVSLEKISFLDAVLKYGGTSVRGSDLYQKGVLKGFIKNVAQGLQGVSNVYSQHKAPILNTIMNIMNGTLREQSYPFTTTGGNSKDKPRDILIFVVGGITFEEAYKVAELNQQQGSRGSRVILGGHNILNSKAFLRELSLFGANYAQNMKQSTAWSYDGDLV